MITLTNGKANIEYMEAVIVSKLRDSQRLYGVPKSRLKVLTYIRRQVRKMEKEMRFKLDNGQVFDLIQSIYEEIGI